jgi:transmembrane sensor
MKDKEYIEKLIARYLNVNCTSKEQLELKDWIGESPDHKREFLSLKDIWDSSLAIKDRSGEQLVLFYKNQYEKSKRLRVIWIKTFATVAATLLLGLILTLLIPYKKVSQPENLQVFSVPLGSRSKVLLADGTEVSLNSGSELRYSSAYTSANRVVSLSGEGFFKVKSDPQHPFTVKTFDFDIRVTGTEFNVCSYNDDRYSAATLAHGKINLQMKGTSQFFKIEPGEKFQLDRETRKYSLSNADVESEIAWKDGEFIFRKIPFPDLVQKLERWYDVKLNYSDSKLQSYAFTGRFKNQETIWQVLDALKLTSPIDYRKTTFREFTIIYKPLKMK